MMESIAIRRVNSKRRPTPEKYSKTLSTINRIIPIHNLNLCCMASHPAMIGNTPLKMKHALDTKPPGRKTAMTTIITIKKADWIINIRS